MLKAESFSCSQPKVGRAHTRNHDVNKHKRDDEAMRNRINDIQLSTHTSFALHPTLVTAYGLRTNTYSGSIQSVITADDLFRQVD